jgi:hypothetical protein
MTAMKFQFLLCLLLGAPMGLAAVEPPRPTTGGAGGRILRVTTLAAEGKGSLAEAVRAKGPRIVVFEVGGVIDLKQKTLSIKEPFVTVAGQTAPSPGITLIRGGLYIAADDVIVQHLRVRPGQADREEKSGWECDGISTGPARRVLIDHCSTTWATDENLSVSGPRFEGKGVDEWRTNTSHHVTISNCLIAECLSKSAHGKGEHSKGSLLHDNTTDLILWGNLYASNVERNPLAKGGVQAIIVNNWISNPGKRAIHHILAESEWKGHAPVASRLAIVGNLLEHGPSTTGTPALFHNHKGSPVALYMEDNLAFDTGERPVPIRNDDEEMITLLSAQPDWFPAGVRPLPASRVKEQIAANVGARPWDRDVIDARIVQAALDGQGKIIDGEDEAGGYPSAKPTQAPFREEEWDLKRMERLNPSTGS